MSQFIPQRCVVIITQLIQIMSLYNHNDYYTPPAIFSNDTLRFINNDNYYLLHTYYLVVALFRVILFTSSHASLINRALLL